MSRKKNNKDDENQAVEGSLKEASKEARQRALDKMKQAQDREAAKPAGEDGSTGDPENISSGSMADFVGEASESEKESVPQERMVDEATGQQLLRSVKVYSPFKVYFENDAFSVSAVNGTGPFDILPGHKNFLSLLLPGELTVRGRTGEEKLKIERGVMHVHNDVIKVFLDV